MEDEVNSEMAYSVAASVRRSPERHTQQKVFFSFAFPFFPWLGFYLFFVFRKRNGKIRSNS